jgi:hypothetical protein
MRSSRRRPVLSRRKTGRRSDLALSGPPDEARHMSPDEYCQERAAASGSSFLLQLPLPRSGAPPGHHRALRLLPRSRRRGRRMPRSAAGARPSSPGGARNWPPPCTSGHPTHPVTQALARSLKATSTLPQEQLLGNHRRHGDGPRAGPLCRLQGAAPVLLPRRQRRSACLPPKSSATTDRLHPEIRPRPRAGLPAHQHHPRRRRGRPPRPHLSAGRTNCWRSSASARRTILVGARYSEATSGA